MHYKTDCGVIFNIFILKQDYFLNEDLIKSIPKYFVSDFDKVFSNMHIISRILERFSIFSWHPHLFSVFTLVFLFLYDSNFSIIPIYGSNKLLLVVST